MSKAPPPKGVRSMSSLAAELAGQDRDPVPGITQKGLRLVFIPFSKIRQFTGHPFRLYIGERLSDMVESIRQNGILMPLIVRRVFDDGEHDYEMLSGHNRMNAGQIAGLDGAWCLVKEGLTDAEALMYVIETNMLQRSFSDLLPSEKAAVLSLRYSEMFSQGKRNDILRELEVLEGGGETCGSDFHRSNSRDTLGEDYDLTGRQVANYLRVNQLLDCLRLKLDGKLLTLSSAVSLSYLSRENQLAVFAGMNRYPHKMSDTQAAGLRKLAETESLTEQGVVDFLRNPKPSGPKTVSIGRSLYYTYFKPGTSKQEVERVIGEALALYFGQAKGESA